MNVKSLREARKAAQIFLAESKELQANLDKDRFYHNPKVTGSVRRKSMDLTRALAEMRKHG